MFQPLLLGKEIILPVSLVTSYGKIKKNQNLIIKVCITITTSQDYFLNFRDCMDFGIKIDYDSIVKGRPFAVRTIRFTIITFFICSLWNEIICIKI